MKRAFRTRCSLQPVLSLLLLVIGTPVRGDVWTGFQNGGDVSLDTGSGATGNRLSDEIAWTADLPGYGQSSPVVWNDSVYVTSVTGENKETCHVTAFVMNDGSRLWQASFQNASPQESSNYVSRAAPTPAADENGVIVCFEGGNLAALSHGGDVRWERNLVQDYGPIDARHGLAASVEQDAESAYIWVERSTQPYVLSINKQNGETRWKVSGVGGTSWASPRLVPVGGGQHLVLSAVGRLIGLDPETGRRLWAVEGLTGNSTPTPVPLGAGRFLIGATVGRGEEAGSGRAAESNGVVAIAQNETGSWEADYVWRAKRATSSFGSPIAHGGTAWFVNRSGVLYALDLETGAERFAQRLSGSIWATPIGLGNRIYFFGKDGPVDILSTEGDQPEVTTWQGLPPDPEAQRARGRNALSGSVLYAAAWCRDAVLLRRGDRLFCVRVAGGNE